MGFGTSPAGAFPFGFGAEEEVATPTSPTAFSRQIDPATKDYAIENGAFKRMPPLRQRVVLALSTLRLSSTVLRDWGVGVPRKMGSAAEAEVDASVRLALRQLAEVERAIVIDSVTTERGSGGRARAVVRWRDVMTDTTNTDPVLLG